MEEAREALPDGWDSDESRAWVDAMNAEEDRRQKPIMAAQLADPDFGRGGPDPAEFLPDDYDIERRLDAEFVALQTQAREAFDDEWQFYRQGREAPAIDVHEQGSSIAAAEPSITLATEQSGPGVPGRDSGGVRVDARGGMSTLTGHSVEQISPQEAAARLGVRDRELGQAVTAASAGLRAAQPHGQRFETLDTQQELEAELALPDPVAEAEIRFERATDPTLAYLPEGDESVLAEDAPARGPEPTLRREPDAIDRPAAGQGKPLAPLHERIERARDSTLSPPVAPQQSGGPMDGLPRHSIDGPPQGIARQL